MNSTTKIDPCVCGGRAIPCMSATGFDKKCYVKCIKCERATEKHSTISQAVFDWNNTAITAPLKATPGGSKLHEDAD